ncbi:MAG: S4 domain-containing protein YaaA [Tissierellia bacterium]|nr:S4 domain-containing protein YaaA [Tissierellia bacterium]
MNEIKIDTEFIKLEQLLKLAGIVDSGGIAKMIIQDELIKVNGEIETRRGRKIYPDDKVEYEGEIFLIK